MNHFAALFLLSIISLTSLGVRAASLDTPPARIPIAVIDWDYVDTSGEERDQRQEHDARRGVFMAAVKRDLAAGDAFRLVEPVCNPSPCAMSDSPKDDLLAAARGAGAQLLITGGFHKMSTLVQFARAEAVDASSGRSVYSWLFTFRGDSDQAWTRAESFAVRQITAGIHTASLTNVVPGMVSGSASTPVIKLALFDFELEDFSAGAGSATGESADAVTLGRVTSDVRRLVGESGRYEVVDTSTVLDAAARTRALHHCDGCEAAMALRLGADQSFIGVVSRVSRTEYLVRYEVRDARSGSVILRQESPLRLGADYSWSRGAVSLLKEGLLNPTVASAN
jgi:hypothetical protein